MDTPDPRGKMPPDTTDPRVGPLVKMLLSDERKRGLWVHGPRQSGTTTLALNVGLALPDELVPASLTINGSDLAAKVREIWRLDGLVRRAFADDLLQDLYRRENELDAVWATPVLFVNDVLNIDVDFWSKHIMHRLDTRMKEQQALGGYTLVAGNIAPDRFPPEWSGGLAAFFHVYDIGSRGAR